ncbi:nucleoporin p54 isoform X2 [Hypanus sabinus]|uniref:nucleoporin p54 isoform X2 n=1 Tax=Hypanus sabinus TaxID=79690 RepID=UPI0028C448E3|nr:nucleoporin p54 isoform X2 [Hypanus sabinus]
MAFNLGGGTSGTTGFSFGSFGAKTTATTGFGFGTTATTAASGFGGFAPFGTTTTTTSAQTTGFPFGASTGGFGGFGTTTTAAPAFSFSTPANSGVTGLFQNTQNKGFGFGGGFGTGTSTGLAPGLVAGSTLGGFGSFGTQQQTGGLLGQTLQPQAQTVQLINTASALSAPILLGDERDAILARWNQLQAFWGTGKGYFHNNLAPVEFTQENHFCRFKTVGFSCIPSNKDEDGLVALAFNKKEADIRNQQQLVVETLHKILGGLQQIMVNVEGIRALPDDQTEMVIYVVERFPNGNSRRVSATNLFNSLEQTNMKNQLMQLGVVVALPRTELSPTQIKQLLQNPPTGVDPIIWEQAKVDNPDPEKLIPVPMVGFKELLRRLKFQEQMTKQHQSRLDIISEDVNELQKNQATTVAKIAQYKRKLMDQAHKVLQVLIKQEIQRKAGYAIQAEEEQLRVQLDTIQCELNAPTQFKGRLNELMSQIRMQNHVGAVRSEERYSVDVDLLGEIKQHLKLQQEGLSHLISVLKEDLEDVKLVEHGLSESVHIRRDLLS